MNLRQHLIGAASQRGFVQCDDVCHVVALAAVSGLPALLWGPGGFGKTALVETAFSCLYPEVNQRTVQLGAGTQFEELFGGVDLSLLESEGRLRYGVERSFLAVEAVLLDEVLDLCGPVAESMKSLLTSRKLVTAHGQVAPMDTEVLIGATNREPKEFAQDASLEAFIQRFPLQLHVAPAAGAELYRSALQSRRQARRENRSGAGSFSYEAASEMKSARTRLADVDDRDVIGTLAETAGGLEPKPSLRTLEWVSAVCRTEAAIHGRAQATLQDMEVLRFVYGMDAVGGKLKEELTKAKNKAEAGRKLAEARTWLSLLNEELDRAVGPVRICQAARKLQVLSDRISQIKVKDDMTKDRQALLDAVSKVLAGWPARALEGTKVEMPSFDF